ncbi:MAG TPA: hypothetical protein PKD85_03375 [Saprospiraceae bacterium]|nr:hypothetical protein [Saprospiraceae bacterium]
MNFENQKLEKLLKLLKVCPACVSGYIQDNKENSDLDACFGKVKNTWDRHIINYCSNKNCHYTVQITNNDYIEPVTYLNGPSDEQERNFNELFYAKDEIELWH